MKFLKSTALATGLTSLLLNSGCVSNTSFTKEDTSRLSKKTLKQLEQMPYATPFVPDKYDTSSNLSFEEKENVAKDYARIAPYSGKLYIFDNNNPLNQIKVKTQLNTTGPLNNSLGALKAIENEIPENVHSYSFTLADLADAKKYQLSTSSGFLGFINFNQDKYNTGVKVDVKERNSMKNGDKYQITLSFGEKNLEINHSRTDTRTPAKLAIGTGIGFVIADIPGAVLVPTIEGSQSLIDYTKGRKLPSNTRITQNADNAGNLEEKVSNTYNIVANASKLNAGETIIFSYNNGVQTGTAAIFAKNAKMIFIGPNAKENLGENEIRFTATEKGASEFLYLIKAGVEAGLIRAGMELNKETINTIINPITGSGGRNGGSGGSPASGSGGRNGAPGGNP